jgi:hypothetical protein
MLSTIDKAESEKSAGVKYMANINHISGFNVCALALYFVHTETLKHFIVA